MDCWELLSTRVKSFVFVSQHDCVITDFIFFWHGRDDRPNDLSYIILLLSPMAENLYDLYVFLSQFRPRDALQRVCLLSYARDQSAFCAFLVEVQTNAGYIHATHA